MSAPEGRPSPADAAPAEPTGTAAPATGPATTAAARVARRARRSALLGAVFLMATSAIGPGFLTQTASFTSSLGAAFAFVIVVSVLLDIVIQLNVWRIVAVSRLRANELADRVVPGLGVVLGVAVAVGGVVFNIGNIAGAGLGAHAATGVDVRTAATVTAVLAVALFLVKKAGRIMDRVIVGLGFTMIALTVYVAVRSHPPLGEAVRNVVAPGTVDVLAIVTLVGGTVGGYITFAGAHRMLDSGQGGVENLPSVTRTSVVGVVVTGVMRSVLFLAVLGVVAGGVSLGTTNPAGDAFRAVAGDVGETLFGVVLWAAALSSVVGASYTSATFLTRRRGGGAGDRRQAVTTVVFIAVSLVLYLVMGSAPATLLVFAGAFNGLILPVGLAIMLYVAVFRSRDLLHGYRYRRWLLVLGVLGLVVTVYLAVRSFGQVFAIL